MSLFIVQSEEKSFESHRKWCWYECYGKKLLPHASEITQNFTEINKNNRVCCHGDGGSMFYCMLLISLDAKCLLWCKNSRLHFYSTFVTRPC